MCHCSQLYVKFNTKLHVVENMPSGPDVLTISRTLGSYKEKMHRALNTEAKNRRALIIIDYAYMKPTSEEIQESKQSTAYEKLCQKTDEYSQRILVVLEAIKAYDRPKPPLIWLDSDYEDISDDKESVKAWMRGSKDFIGCDLITDQYCVAGIEADWVIYLGPDRNKSCFMSRCKGQFVHIQSTSEDY